MYRVRFTAILLSSAIPLMAQTCTGPLFYNANTLTPFDFNTGKMLGFARTTNLPYFTATASIFGPVTLSLPSSNGNQMLTGCFAANPPYVSPPNSYQSGAGSQRSAVIRAADYSSLGLAYLLFRSQNTLQVLKLNEDLSVPPMQVYTFGTGLSSVLAADFNGDGKPDLAVADAGNGTSTSSGAVWILLNNGDTTFKTPVQYPIPGAFAIASGDFNGDGNPDLAVTTTIYSTQSTGSVTILFGNGDGTFRIGPSYPAGQSGEAIAVADINGDGVADLVVADETGNAVGVLLGNRDGTFKPYTTLFPAAGPSYIAIGDFNNDGRADIAFTNSQSGSVTVVLALSGGTFATPQNYVAAYDVSSLIVTDVNQDGHVDLVVGQGSPDAIGPDPNAEQVAVFMNNGDGTFQGAPLYGLGNSPTQIVVADFDGDGNPDVAAANQEGTSFTVQYGTGGGKFGQPTAVPLPSGAGGSTSIASADFNGDGKPDVAIGTTFATGVTLALSQTGRTFKTSTISLSGASLSVAAGDFNGDGKPDLAVALGNPTGQSTAAVSGIAVLLGDGKGGFGAPVVTNGISGQYLVTGDFNGDGKLDLAVANLSITSQGFSAPGVTILLGNGSGMFTIGQTLMAGAYGAYSLTIADVNGDGKPDLLAALADLNFGYYIGVALGNGDGTFKTPTIVTTDFGPQSIAAADFNGDKKVDMVVAHCCGDTDMTYLLGNGDGTFQPEVHFSGGASPYTVLAVDLNGDGRPDLAISDDNENYSGLAILLGLPPLAPEITNVSGASFLITSLSPESIVTGFGAGLATGSTGATTVPLPTNLNGTVVTVTDSAGTARQAPLFYVSPGQVNYEMPAGTALGNAKVTIASLAGQESGYVWIANVAPAFFASNPTTGLGAGSTLRVSPDGTQTPGNIAQVDPTTGNIVPVPIDLGSPGDQVFLTLYATGIRNRTSLAGVSASVADVPAQVQFAGPQGTFDGLDQLNILIPGSLGGKGETAVDLIVDGVQAVPAVIVIQ